MSVPFSLAGRTVMMAGASSGIGAHLSQLFSRAGATMVLGARRLDRVEQLAEALRAHGGRAVAVPLDVTDESSIANAYDLAEAAFGTVDTIIANAGLATGGRSTTVSEANVRRVIDTNLTGLFLTVREGARRMIEAGSAAKENGRIVLIGSITAEMTGQGDAAYAASKAAVAHLCRQFAHEWINKGINVNTVQPGYIRTEINGDWFETAGGKAQIASWHRGRLLGVEALDDMMLYLSSDASRHVTGSTITIDDGQCL